MAGPIDTVLPQQLAATVQLGNRTVGRDVLTGIRDASMRTGVDFTYMMAKANQESGLRADAVNQHSSASGLFQFTRQTWLDTLQRHGSKHGLGDIAAQVQTNARGRLWIPNRESEAYALSLRQNPRLSAIMAAEYAAENRAYLEHTLGRPAGTTDIYLAHFLGPGGAATFLKAAAQTPNRLAEDVLPVAAKHNPNLFMDGGRPRTLTQLYSLLHGTISDAMHRFAGVENMTKGPPPAPPGAKPAVPPPEDMGATRLADAGPPAAPGAKPVPPGYEDMGAVQVAVAGPPASPGAKPAPPAPEDMGATRVADAGPPSPPGPRPSAPGTPAAPATVPPSPMAPPGPAAPVDIRVAQAQQGEPAGSAPVAASDAMASDSTIAQVLNATRAVEDASAARGVTLPGASAVAVAALLDSLTRESLAPAPLTQDGAGVQDAPVPSQAFPAVEAPSAPTTTPLPPEPPAPPLMDAAAEAPFLALARTARGLFEPNAAPWPPASTEAGRSQQVDAYQAGGQAGANITTAMPMSPTDAQEQLAMNEGAGVPAIVTGAGRAEPSSNAPAAPSGRGHDTSLRAAPTDFLTGADATRAISAILGRHRSG